MKVIVCTKMNRTGPWGTPQESGAEQSRYLTINKHGLHEIGVEPYASGVQKFRRGVESMKEQRVVDIMLNAGCSRELVQ